MGMGQSQVAEATTAPPASSLTKFIESHKSTANQEDPLQSQYEDLALQVFHNLKYQHQWTELEMHQTTLNDGEEKRLSRPLLSGIPPKRLYLHPDEQIEIINQEREKKAKGIEEGKLGVDDEPLHAEVEWILPTHLREVWTIEDFAKVVDGIDAVPVGYEGRVKMKWRATKRVLMAIVQDDSTIVYYIMHDGPVKPRQN